MPLAWRDNDAFERNPDSIQLTSAGTLQSAFGGFYTGRELDISTGLYDYRSRWYDPATQMFVSLGSIGFEGGDTNLYL